LAAGLVTTLVWALLAGSALFWVLRAGSQWQPVSAQVTGGSPGMLVADARMVARALGASGAVDAAPAPDVVSRLALRGIVTHGSRGAALIAVDGKPARPVRVGAALEGVEGGWILQSLDPGAAVLAAGDQQARLEMPRKSSPATPEASAGRRAVTPAIAPAVTPAITP
jgi:general secretion pathway protein C